MAIQKRWLWRFKKHYLFLAAENLLPWRPRESWIEVPTGHSWLCWKTCPLKADHRCPVGTDLGSKPSARRPFEQSKRHTSDGYFKERRGRNCIHYTNKYAVNTIRQSRFQYKGKFAMKLQYVSKISGAELSRRVYRYPRGLEFLL